MNGKKSIIIVLAGLLLLSFFFWPSRQERGSSSPEEWLTVAIKGKNLYLQAARTRSEQRKGLMDRTKLCPDKVPRDTYACGMIFFFSERKKHPFWMKNTPLSLDIVWLRDRRVVDIRERTTPFSQDIVWPDSPADTVIEVPAGLSEALGISIGDEINSP